MSEGGRKGEDRHRSLHTLPMIPQTTGQRTGEKKKGTQPVVDRQKGGHGVLKTTPDMAHAQTERKGREKKKKKVIPFCPGGRPTR